MKLVDDAQLAPLVAAQLARLGHEAAVDERLARLCGLFKDRCATTVELAHWLAMVYGEIAPGAEELAQHVTEAVKPALAALAARLAEAPWDAQNIQQAIKATLAEHGLKMPQLATAVRVLVCGRAQTPSIDAVLSLFPRATVLARLRAA
jgi:glutamyl-tRNA synthetase